MGSKHTTKSSTHDKTTPIDWAAPGLASIGNRISAAVAAPPLPMYQGDFIAQPGALQQGLPAQMMQDAEFIRSNVPLAQQAMAQGLEKPTWTKFEDYDTSAIRPVIDAATAPLLRNLTENILPGLRSSGIESGAYGGSRSTGLLPGTAIGNTMRDVNELALNMAYADYSKQQDLGLGAYNANTARLGLTPELLNSMFHARTGATDVQTAAGAYDQQLRQAPIDNALQQYQNQLMYPYQGLDVAASILGPLAQPYASHDARSKVKEKTGGLGEVVKGAMGLASMAMPFIAPGMMGGAMAGGMGPGSDFSFGMMPAVNRWMKPGGLSAMFAGG